MRKTARTRILSLLLALALLCLCAGCGGQEPTRDRREIIEEMVVDYGSYGAQADAHVDGLLLELAGDEDTAFKIYYDTYDIHELPPLEGGNGT